MSTLKHITRALLLLVSSLLIAACVRAHVVHPTPRSSFVEDLKSQTVALVATNDEGIKVPYCTGIWIDEVHILTAYHCVMSQVSDTVHENADPHELILASLEDEEALNRLEKLGEKYVRATRYDYTVENECNEVGCAVQRVHGAVVVKMSARDDLALLVTESDARPAHYSVALADVSPAVGEELHFVGHVMGLYWTYVRGNVAAYREHKKFQPNPRIHGPLLQVSAPVYKGNSGGGAFNKDGELIGLCSFMMQAPSTVFYVHLETIREFLRRS
jgi:hypothetical protein